MLSLPRKVHYTLIAVALLVNPIFAQQNSSPVEVYSLQKDRNNPIIDLLRNASKTIYLTAYVITNSEIAALLVEASHKGVEVKVILEKKQVLGNKFSQHLLLRRANIELKVLSENMGRIVSDYCIIDSKIVYTGGTLLHTDLDENPKVGNYLVFRNNERIATIYRSDFLELFEKAR